MVAISELSQDADMVHFRLRVVTKIIDFQNLASMKDMARAC